MYVKAEHILNFWFVSWKKTERGHGTGNWEVKVGMGGLCKSIDQRFNLWIRASLGTKCSLSTLPSKSSVHSQRQSSAVFTLPGMTHACMHTHTPTCNNNPINTTTSTWPIYHGSAATVWRLLNQNKAWVKTSVLFKVLKVWYQTSVSSIAFMSVLCFKLLLQHLLNK